MVQVLNKEATPMQKDELREAIWELFTTAQSKRDIERWIDRNFEKVETQYQYLPLMTDHNKRLSKIYEKRVKYELAQSIGQEILDKELASVSANAEKSEFKSYSFRTKCYLFTGWNRPPIELKKEY